jgi:hypothetical protein
MAELKARVNLVAICHEGGPVAGTLGDALTVHAASLDANLTVEGPGKAVSVQATLGAGPLTVSLAAFSEVFLLFIKNTATTQTVTVTWGTTSVEVLPLGGVVLASKGGSYSTAGSRASLTVSGAAGATVEVLVAGSED